jgi:hypothetical protein
MVKSNQGLPTILTDAGHRFTQSFFFGPSLCWMTVAKEKLRKICLDIKIKESSGHPARSGFG